ncbi:MAG TPA: hypothetical protein VMB71_04280, partial [Acetobacteraceae bacterium]|nr:hypothetical protein [Acetobacteraceae bacterium]
MHPNGQLCRRILLTTVSGFTLVAMSHAGRAQAAAAPPPAPSGGIEQIIVTAQKRAENVQKVPATVTVIGGKSLENAHIDTGKALSAVTTNLTIDANANFVAPYIRGVGTQYANPGLEPSVATYFDDLY